MWKTSQVFEDLWLITWDFFIWRKEKNREDDREGGLVVGTVDSNDNDYWSWNDVVKKGKQKCVCDYDVYGNSEGLRVLCGDSSNAPITYPARSWSRSRCYCFTWRSSSLGSNSVSFHFFSFSLFIIFWWFSAKMRCHLGRGSQVPPRYDT